MTKAMQIDNVTSYLIEKAGIESPLVKYIVAAGQAMDSNKTVQALASNMGFYIDSIPNVRLYEILFFTLDDFLNFEHDNAELKRIIDMSEDEFLREYETR